MARPQRIKVSDLPPAPPVAGKTTPLLPATSLFPVDVMADPAALETALRDTLRGYRERSEVDPFGDPILMLALDLTRRLDKGEVTPSAVEQLVQRLTTTAFLD